MERKCYFNNYKLNSIRINSRTYQTVIIDLYLTVTCRCKGTDVPAGWPSKLYIRKKSGYINITGCIPKIRIKTHLPLNTAIRHQLIVCRKMFLFEMAESIMQTAMRYCISPLLRIHGNIPIQIDAPTTVRNSRTFHICSLPLIYNLP